MAKPGALSDDAAMVTVEAEVLEWWTAGSPNRGDTPPEAPEPSSGEVVIRRTSTGWRVEGAFPTLPTDTVDDLGHALVLADLLADGTAPGPRPPRSPGDLDEVDQLRASVRQLEHALASRVLVEQAIGVLSERWRVAPRDAFEQLRRVTRSHGLRIHELAKLVIESSTDPDVGLPAELIPLQRGAEGPPEPRQSPDSARSRRGTDPADGRIRRPGSPAPSAGAVERRPLADRRHMPCRRAGRTAALPRPNRPARRPGRAVDAARPEPASARRSGVRAARCGAACAA